jgi:hypothetical protein
MKKAPYCCALLGIAALTIGPPLYLDHRQDLEAKLLVNAAERLSLVPAHFGPWSLREESSLGESVLRLLGCSDHICRTYVHNESGDTVAFVMLVGPSGPLAVHTPEICMTNREYENIKQSEPIAITSDERTHEFFATMFRAKTLEGPKLNVYYGWSRDGVHWEAPESPRTALGPLPMLYKLQVACAAPAVPSDIPTAGVSFLTSLVPFLTDAVKADPVNKITD